MKRIKSKRITNRFVFGVIILVMTAVSAFSRAEGLPYPQGQVVGPVEDGQGSSYFLYLPKSLPSDRKAPLLFYTHSLGGDSLRLKEIMEGAELTGWVMALSVQSKNGLPMADCVQYSRNSIQHILHTIPVDKNRIYFAGNSGGAAQAFRNADQIDACGVISNVGYIPSDCSAPLCDCFIMNGGWDYNRYPSAYARKMMGRRAIHRFYNGGHQVAPAWLMVEGMVWLEGRYLVKKGKRCPDEQQFYEQSMLQWLAELEQTEPSRAYYWALFLQDELSVSSDNKASLNQIVQLLSDDELNRLYVEGVASIDDFSQQTLSRFGAGSLHQHSDKRIVAACDRMLQKYKDVPLMGETLEALRKPTQ